MADREKRRTWLEADYLGDETPPAPEHRVANAMEYIAYHIGQIDKKLTKIATELERSASKPR